jgi:hypothetical protein
MAVALKGYNQCVYGSGGGANGGGGDNDGGGGGGSGSGSGSGGDEEITLDVAADFKHSARVTSTKVFRSMAGLHKLHPVGP